ncbi:MAG: serine O-acetyltransferase [Erysipelotrichaceae bacterium]
MTLKQEISYNIDRVLEYDPAARSRIEVLLLYPHIRALIAHHFSHKLYLNKHYFMARWVGNRSRRKTGIEIHPGAVIGKGLVIDHGMGVVIGETAIVKDNVLIYHGVTLGGNGKEHVKRHPTVGNNVMIGCGAKILGNIEIGDNTQIGANAVVTKSTAANSTVIGIPAKEKKA